MRLLLLAVTVLGCGDGRDAAPIGTLRAHPAPVAAKGRVKVSGTVIDDSTTSAARGVIVTLRGAAGDVEMLASDGKFELAVVPGRYRMMVRDPANRLIMVALSDRVRLDEGPRGELAAPDTGLMPTLDVDGELHDIEVVVTPAATVKGFVIAPDGVGETVVRVRPAQRSLTEVRPVLGTDVARVDASGAFTLRVPAGAYVLEAANPRYAGTGELAFALTPGQLLELSAALIPGCIISGRVVQADGTPAHDGAIEKLGDVAFGPVGAIEAGGKFRWTTMKEGDVTLRAWPWKSAPSPPRTFHCRDGKRFTDEVLSLPDDAPDVSGVVVDAHGAPVPLAFIDVTPLDPQPIGLGASQQERADASGAWHVYEVPPGRYKISATAPGRGMIETTIKAPRTDLRLTLGGTGRIVGTTSPLANGSLEVSLLHCGAKDNPLPVAHEPRIVPVVGGRFAIENVPACALTLAVRWRDQIRQAQVVVDPDRAVALDLDLGEPREKTVTGTVRDHRGKPVPAARVTVIVAEKEVTTVRCDDSGRFSLKTQSGAQLVAGDSNRAAHALVGRANVPSEQVELVLEAQ